MAFSLTAISPEAVSEDGGYLLRVIGDFSGTLGDEYRIHVGQNGDATDEECHSGKAGKASSVYPLNTTELRGYTPSLDPGTYDVFVRNLTKGTSDVLSNALTFYARDFQTSVYDLRRVLRLDYVVGPRSIDREEPL